MPSARLGIQTAIVLVLVVFVSWPDYARLKGATVRQTTATDRHTHARELTAGARARRYEIGYGSVSLQRASTVGSAALHRKLYEENFERRGTRTPQAVLMLGGRLNAIVGYVRTGLNVPVPFGRLVLRNPVTGEVEARATADANGLFSFVDVMPNGYVVELLGAEDSVSATSELVTVGVGELRQTVVRVSQSRQALAAFGGLTPTADEPIAAATADGINAVTAPDRSISPQR